MQSEHKGYVDYLFRLQIETWKGWKFLPENLDCCIKVVVLLMVGGLVAF